MRVVAYSTRVLDGQVLIRESGGARILSNSLSDLWSFLLEPYEDCIKVCWDLDQTVSVLLRLLGKAACQALRTRKKWHDGPFGVFYVPGKVFSLSHVSGAKMSLYGLEQYFPDLEEPDVEDVQALGVKLLKELAKMGLHPTKLTSPVAIYEESILSKLDLPRLKDMPKEVAEYAYACSGRLWIEAHQISYFEKVWDYDLSSAFPTIVKDLVDFRECAWIRSPEYQERAIYGFVKCQVTIYDWVMVSPIVHDIEEALISPVGTWETHLTKEELDFIAKWKIGEVKIQDGWWAVTTRKAFKRPLKLAMEKLLAYKQGTELQRLLAKRMSTGIYGKLGEERSEEFGPYFNPVWFSIISTKTRLQVADYLYSHGIGPGDNEGYRTLCAIGVDGFMVSQPLVATTEGQWKLAYEGPALILGSGLVFTNRTKPKGLSLSEALAMIKEHPRSNYYVQTLRRRLTLGDALAQDRIEDIGKEMNFTVSLSLLGQKHDRDFPVLPQTGEQLLKKKFTSRPIRV